MGGGGAAGRANWKPPKSGKQYTNCGKKDSNVNYKDEKMLSRLKPVIGWIAVGIILISMVMLIMMVMMNGVGYA